MSYVLPNTINEVVKKLDQIIEETIAANNYLGIFAYVYRRTTVKIQDSILEKRFEDNERMEKFDVVFANHYIEAYENYKLNQPISKSWMSTFEVKDQPITIIQHIMMGMNAHISFDLGVTAGEFTFGENIDSLKNDFMLVNQILEEITNEMQTRLSKVSRLMFLLDWVGKEKDEKIINFGIVKSRQFAWEFANGIATVEFNDNAKNTLIETTDNTVAAFNKIIQSPRSRILNFVLRIISYFEKKNIGEIIHHLRQD
jgi:hypothetical protein